jgi:hypothetical protein
MFFSSNGVVAANFVIDLKAFSPAFAEPNNVFNCTDKFSTCIPASTNPFNTTPAPNPKKHFLN